MRNEAKDLAELFAGIENDFRTLALNPSVTFREDSRFTSFLHADASTFTYDYSPAETKIIELFSAYRLTHPEVNSVYMGRENGAFVRSHERVAPTAYDPRERPWYIEALKTPGAVARTAAYSSITSSDVNIGSSLTLRDATGRAYGVVGMDVTLAALSARLSAVELPYGAWYEIWDHAGTVLVSSHIERVGQAGTLPVGLTKTDRRIGRGSYVPLGSAVASFDRFGDCFALYQGIAVPAGNQVVLFPRSEFGRIIADAMFAHALNGTIVLLANEESRELKKIKFMVITSLASLAQKRDNETGLHILRTQKYMDILASAYNRRFPEKAADQTRITHMVLCAPSTISARWRYPAVSS